MSAIGDQSFLRQMPAGAAAGAVGTGRGVRLDARPSFLQSGQHRADHPLCGADRLASAAAGSLFSDRRGVVGNRSRRLPRFAGASESGRLLGVHPRLVLLFRLWLLSARRTLARRRVLCCSGVRRRVAVAAVDAAPRPRRVVFFHRLADPVLRAAARRAADRACRRADVAVGRHPRDRRGGDHRHRVLAAARHSAGARTALRAAGGQSGFGHLHRIRPRRAGDHRFVHGERDAAAVRSGALRARQARARADRRGFVRVRLYGGGRARRACRRAARAIRGGRRAGAELLADDGACHPAAGAPHHAAQHRQHLHRPVQGHDAGLRRRHFRFPADAGSGARRSEDGRRRIFR